MLHRQWWPSCQAVRSGLDTEADTSSTVDLTTSSAASSTPPEDDSVTWQELLVRKLLPKHSMSASQHTPAASLQASPVSSSTMSILSSGKHDARAASSQGWQYAGIFLDPLSTARLLAWAPPRHSRLQGDHMSLFVKPSPEQLSSLDLGCEVSLSVLARTENAAIQVVAVQCPPWASQLLQRPAHITISTAEGVKANSAGDLLRKVEKGHIYGVQTSSCADNINLTGRVGVKLLNGSVAYSVAELSSAPNTEKCSDSKTDKCPDLEPVSAPHGHQSQLFSCSLPSQRYGSQFPTALPICTAGLTSLRPTPSGPLQAHPSFQAYTADIGLSKAGTAAAPPFPRSQPPVQHVPDLNDDDAFDAICDLDALLAPPLLPQPAPAASHSSRHSAEQHRRQCSPHTRPSSVHLCASTAHSGSPEQHQYSQSQSFSPKKADVRARVYSPKKAEVRPQLYSPNTGDGRCSANAQGSGRCLWTGDEQAAAEAAPLSAPMSILKRPLIPDQQASGSAASHPLPATASVPKASLSRASGAAAGSVITPCSIVGTIDNPVSATSSTQSPTSVSGLNHSQSQQSMQGSKVQRAARSLNGSASKAPSVAAVSSSDELTSAACCTALPAAKLGTPCAFPPGFPPNNSTACAFPPGLQPRGADHRHHTDAVRQLVMELQEQPVLAEASGLEPAGQVAQDEIGQGGDLPHQLRPSNKSSQATDSAPTSTSWQQTGSHATQSTVVPQQPPPTDVACTSAVEQVTTSSALPPDDSSVSLPGSSQPVLLPAGTTSAVPLQLSSEAAAAQSPSVHASADALMPAPSLQQTTNAGSLRSEADSLDLSRTERPGVVLPHQLDFLMTDDPVATAIVEANKVVADRAGLMSLADQRREALNLHVQAKDTYFAAAQTAHEKGDRDAALQLAAKGKEHAQLAKEARQAANQAAFESFNLHVTNRFKVDLHGLHVEEALQVLEQHLLTLGGLGCPGGVLLQIITGVGKHSINGRPKILPAVVRYLSDAGYRFTETLGNSGVLEVNIGGHRRLLEG